MTQGQAHAESAQPHAVEKVRPPAAFSAPRVRSPVGGKAAPQTVRIRAQHLENKKKVGENKRRKGNRAALFTSSGS